MREVGVELGGFVLSVRFGVCGGWKQKKLGAVMAPRVLPFGNKIIAVMVLDAEICEIPTLHYSLHLTFNPSTIRRIIKGSDIIQVDALLIQPVYRH